MKYYLAYGSNLNKMQMKYRCPNAKVVGTAILFNYELVFRLFLTVEKHIGGQVPVAIWEITEECEMALDRYEGYPIFYRKEEMIIEFDGKMESAIIYIMNDVREVESPTPQYLDAVKAGYKHFKFDIKILMQALQNSFKI